MSKDEALKIVAEIRELTQDFGYPNEQAKQKVARLVNCLRNDGQDDDYYRGKLSSVVEFSTVGFSTRKFKKYPGGAEQVMGFVIADIGIAEDIINERWPR